MFKWTTTYNDLEVPLSFKYEIASNFDIDAVVKHVFGLSEKEKIKAENGFATDEFPVQGNQNKDIKSVDGGFGFVAGSIQKR